MQLTINEYIEIRDKALMALQLLVMLNTLITGLILVQSMKCTYKIERSKVNPVFNTPGASLFRVTLHKYQWFIFIQIVSVLFTAIVNYNKLAGMHLVLESTERVIINGIQVDKCAYRDNLFGLTVIVNKLVK